MSNTPYVELANLGKSYPTPHGPAVIVHSFNLRMREGETVSLIGHSGCGKSTVLSMVAGLNPVTTGSIAIAGREIEGPGPDRGVVFQSPCLLPWMTAFENVMLGVNRVYPHATKPDRRQLAEHYLGLVGLGDAMHKRPRELSQGMQQRVGLARAFAIQPKLLLLDEPFGMLDSLTRMELQAVLTELLQRCRITTILVTHDVDEALLLSDRVAMMTTGPAATLGQLVDVPFAHPRDRAAVLDDDGYDRLKCTLLDFLEAQAHHPGPAADAAALAASASAPLTQPAAATG